MKASPGVTAVEAWIASGVVIVVFAVIAIVINPSAYSGKFRNAERIANSQAILNAVERKVIADEGQFKCDSGELPWAASMENPGTADAYYNMAPCLVPEYLDRLPFDPAVGYWHSVDDYKTGYQVGYDPRSSQITVTAPHADPPDLVHVSR